MASRSVAVCCLTAVWLLCASAGIAELWKYDNAPGADALAPARWPAASRLALAPDRPTLVLLAHPQCSCTTATLAELGETLARVQIHPKTYVLFLKPEAFANGWEETPLWQTAAALPAVTVLRDENGDEARRFGSETSGQTLLYDTSGRLLFSGGITGSRGHTGDNAGMLAVVTLLNHGRPERSKASVFGCPLFASGI